MDAAIIINAHTPVGLAISRKLVHLGYRVYGFGDDFSKSDFNHTDWTPITVNIEDTVQFTQKLHATLHQEKHIASLLLLPSIDPKRAFNKTAITSINSKITKSLYNPILATKLCLPALEQFQGTIINIKNTAPKGPLADASASALHHFLNALFEETRDSGIAIAQINLSPNLERTTKDVARHSSSPNTLSADLIANAIERLLHSRSTNFISEITIRPQSTKDNSKLLYQHEPIDEFKAFHLPTIINFPKEPEPIRTPRAEPDPIERPSRMPKTEKKSPSPRKKITPKPQSKPKTKKQPQPKNPKAQEPQQKKSKQQPRSSKPSPKSPKNKKTTQPKPKTNSKSKPNPDDNKQPLRPRGRRPKRNK